MKGLEAYQLLAPIYERFHDHETMEHLRTLVMQHTRPGRVLDVGSGTGLMGRYLAHQGYQVTLLDGSDAMLKQAVQYAQNEGITVKTITRPLLNAWPQGFDVVVASMDVVNHLEDESQFETFFRHAYQSLNSGGTLIFDALTCKYIQAFHGYQETLKSDLGPVFWQTKPGSHACSLEHHFTHQNRHYVLKERSFSPAVFKRWLNAFKHITHTPLNDRHVFIVKR